MLPNGDLVARCPDGHFWPLDWGVSFGHIVLVLGCFWVSEAGVCGGFDDIFRGICSGWSMCSWSQQSASLDISCISEHIGPKTSCVVPENAPAPRNMNLRRYSAD